MAAPTDPDQSVESGRRHSVSGVVGGLVFLLLGAVELVGEVRRPEAHLRPGASWAYAIAWALLVAAPGIIAVVGLVWPRLRSFRGAAVLGFALAVAAGVPLGVIAAVPAWLMWRAGRQDARSRRGGDFLLGASAFVILFTPFVLTRSTGAYTCWIERVDASGHHSYIETGGHSGVSLSSATGDIGGGCDHLPTLGRALVSMAFVAIAIGGAIVAARRTPQQKLTA